MIEKIGVDRSKELKITEEENDLENWKRKKKLKQKQNRWARKADEQSGNLWNQ